MDIVIVGGGVAGITAARTLRENDSTTKIDVYTDENHLYYPRPRLYEVLSGEVKPQDTYAKMIIHPGHEIPHLIC